MSESVKFQYKVPKSIKKEFESYLTKEKTGANLLSEMLESYKIVSSLKTNHAENIDKVCRIKKLNFNQVIDEALIDYTKKSLKVNKDGGTGNTKSIAADKKISAIIEQIIDSNNKAKDLSEAIYINQTSIIKWMNDNKTPLVNFAVIKRYLRLNADYLEQHHKKLNITPSHNRQIFMKKRFSKND